MKIGKQIAEYEVRPNGALAAALSDEELREIVSQAPADKSLRSDEENAALEELRAREERR
jgi:hypothetical protein